MAWSSIPLTSPLDVSSTYRATFFLNLPDTLDWKNKVVSVIRGADKFIHSLPQILQFGYQRISITKVETGNANTSNAQGRINPWPIRITFTVLKAPAGGGANWSTVVIEGQDDPNVLPAALFAPEVLELLGALILIATIAFVVVSRSLEKLIAPVFNPGFAILVVVAIALIVGGRRGHVPALSG